MNIFWNIQKRLEQFGSGVYDATHTKEDHTQSYLSKWISNVTGIGMKDPTQSLLFKGVQWGANLFTGAKESLQWIWTQWQSEFDRKKEIARNFLTQKWYSPDVIENTISKIDYTPWFWTRLATGLWNRLQEAENTTERLQKEWFDPLAGKVTAKWLVTAPLSYAGDVVWSAMEPIWAAISPVVQKVIEKTWQAGNVAEIGKWWEWVRQSNPNFADALEGIVNISSVAPLPLAKPIAGAVKQGGIATGKAIVSGVEKVAPMIKNIPKSVKKVPSFVDDAIETGVEKLATKAIWSSDWSAELFKATSPSYNVLAKSKDIWKIKQKARIADEAVVEAWYIPKTTTERVDAYKWTMKKVWDEIEKARWSVSEKYKSDSIANTIKSEIENMKVNGKIPPSLESDVTALLKEADFYKSLWDVSLPDLWVIRSNINARLTFWDKTQFSDAYNAVMKKVITAIKEWEDAVLTKNAGKATSGLLAKYWSLRSMLDDVIKQDIKASRAKWLPIEESFGRISGLAEMAGWVWQIVMNPKQAIPSIVSGGSKVILWKVAWKMKDPDYLIKTGYEKLLQSKKPKNGNISWNPTVVRTNSNSTKTK